MTYIYILLAIIILWQIGADIRYYQINKKIQIMHDTDKNLLELVQTCMMKKDEKKEEKPKRSSTKRVVKKAKRVRATKKGSDVSKAKISKS